MNITLSKIHYVASMSQETNCFDAVVCIDGKPSFYVSNNGCGGCNMYDGIPNNPNWHNEFKRVEEYAKLNYTEFNFEQVDSLVDDLLERHMMSKKFTNILKKKMLVTSKSKSGMFAYKMPYTPEFLSRIQAKDPDIDKCLNTLPFDEAFELFLKNNN